MDVKANNSVYPILIMALEAGVAGVEMTGHIGYGEDKRGKAVKRYNGELNGATLFPKWQASPHAVVKKAVTDAGFDPEEFDLTGAAEALSKADVIEDEDPAETEEAAAMLVSANEAATAFATGEATARGALYDLSVIIANAIETMGDSFDTWLARGNPALHDQFSSEVSANAKSEFLAVGRLPREYFDAMPPRTMTPKAVQYNFNVDKGVVGENIAKRVHELAEDQGYSAATVTAALKAAHDAYGKSDADDRQSRLARIMFDHIAQSTDGFSVDCVKVTEGEDGKFAFEAAKDGDGNYVVSAQFAVRARAHELLAVVAKSCQAEQPMTADEAEEHGAEETRKSAAKEAAKADFADISPLKAAAHLCGILQARDTGEGGDADMVYRFMGEIMKRADEAGWRKALDEAVAAATKLETEAKDKADAEAADAAADDAA